MTVSSSVSYQRWPLVHLLPSRNVDGTDKSHRLRKRVARNRMESRRHSVATSICAISSHFVGISQRAFRATIAIYMSVHELQISCLCVIFIVNGDLVSVRLFCNFSCLLSLCSCLLFLQSLNSFFRTRLAQRTSAMMLKWLVTRLTGQTTW